VMPVDSVTLSDRSDPGERARSRRYARFQAIKRSSDEAHRSGQSDAARTRHRRDYDTRFCR
jgi:hypothetical protein